MPKADGSCKALGVDIVNSFFMDLGDDKHNCECGQIMAQKRKNGFKSLKVFWNMCLANIPSGYQGFVNFMN